MPSPRKNKRSILTREQLEALTTPRLLAYRNSLLRNYEDEGWGDPPEWHKQHPEWKAHYAMVKEILAERPHVEKK